MALQREKAASTLVNMIGYLPLELMMVEPFSALLPATRDALIRYARSLPAQILTSLNGLGIGRNMTDPH